MCGKVMKVVIANALLAYLDVDALMIKRVKVDPPSTKALCPKGHYVIVGMYKLMSVEIRLAHDKTAGSWLEQDDIAAADLTEIVQRFNWLKCSPGPKGGALQYYDSHWSGTAGNVLAKFRKMDVVEEDEVKRKILGAKLWEQAGPDNDEQKVLKLALKNFDNQEYTGVKSLVRNELHLWAVRSIAQDIAKHFKVLGGESQETEYGELVPLLIRSDNFSDLRKNVVEWKMWGLFFQWLDKRDATVPDGEATEVTVLDGGATVLNDEQVVDQFFGEFQVKKSLQSSALFSFAKDIERRTVNVKNPVNELDKFQRLRMFVLIEVMKRINSDLKLEFWSFSNDHFNQWMNKLGEEARLYDNDNQGKVSSDLRLMIEKSPEASSGWEWALTRRALTQPKSEIDAYRTKVLLFKRIRKEMLKGWSDHV